MIRALLDRLFAVTDAPPPLVLEPRSTSRTLPEYLRETAKAAWDRGDFVAHADCIQAAVTIERLERELAEARQVIWACAFVADNGARWISPLAMLRAGDRGAILSCEPDRIAGGLTIRATVARGR